MRVVLTAGGGRTRPTDMSLYGYIFLTTPQPRELHKTRTALTSPNHFLGQNGITNLVMFQEVV